MRIAVPGSTGMLGKRVVSQAIARGHQVLTPRRTRSDTFLGLDIEFWKDYDVIINCAGIIPPGPDPTSMILANALGPWELAEHARHINARLVHMSTDCVFSGKEHGWLDSKSSPSPSDLYGKTKLCGEPVGGNVLVVRGSFIGPEHGFFHWLLHARGVVDAWMSALWNGGSADRMAEVLLNLAESDQVGILHVGAEEYVTKAWMVEYLVEMLNLPVSVNLVREPQIYRALFPDVLLPPVKQSLDELIAEFNGDHKWDDLE